MRNEIASGERKNFRKNSKKDHELTARNKIVNQLKGS